MDAEQFIRFAEQLTGTPVKDVTTTDREVLMRLLIEESRPICQSQLNELLLLVNKDRMEPSFFDYFFGVGCTIGTLDRGLGEFQQLAMLCFGNFIYAYRFLSRSPSVDSLREKLGEWARKPAEIRDGLARRGEKLVDIELIPRDDTPLVGYISAGEVIAESERCAFLQKHLHDADGLPRSDWQMCEESLTAADDPRERSTLGAMVSSYRRRFPEALVAQFASYLGGVAPILQGNATRLSQVRGIAARNQDIYLTWDHMDVYFATSMRKVGVRGSVRVCERANCRLATRRAQPPSFRSYPSVYE